MKTLRCAVYTRKSTEDGLEQEFNSLDAQREACEAYIASQRHEGWTLVPARYDDGGFSGGNMERPGLKALLDAVDAGDIDVIVVYKVDRLTRSLADFAKIVERLDARSASFVSVTQAFNTTTSMGRLTLNVLLSFAQFEREVTGERIRDKIAASKKKGLWMGGPVPLGYEVVDRKLVPVPDEAERVSRIMRRYLEVGTVPALIGILRAEGIVTKIQRRTSGPHRGGIPFARGSLFHLLKNPVYRGKIVHRDKVYDGEHEPIIDEDLWNAVQAQLAAKAPQRKRPKNDRQNALLVGLVSDPEGRPMVPTYATRGTRRYSYYETRKDLVRPNDPPPTRHTQGALDAHMLQHLDVLLGDEHGLRRMAGLDGADLLRTLFEGARARKASLKATRHPQADLRALVAGVRVQRDHLAVAIRPAALGLGDRPCWHWRIPLPVRKPFREAKLRIDSAAAAPPANRDLVALLADAQGALDLVQSSPDLSLNQIGKREGRCRTHLARLLRIAWLSPRIVEAIASGTQPARLTRQALLSIDLPIDWADQERLLGLAD